MHVTWTSHSFHGVSLYLHSVLQQRRSFVTRNRSTHSAGNLPVSLEFLHKGQWRKDLMFSLICAWLNGWVNNREDGDLRRHRTHYDTTVMQCHKTSGARLNFDSTVFLFQTLNYAIWYVCMGKVWRPSPHWAGIVYIQPKAQLITRQLFLAVVAWWAKCKKGVC